MVLGSKQKKILEILAAYPSCSVMQVASTIYGRTVLRRSKEYNSTLRSIHMLEEQGFVVREGGQVKWSIKSKAP